MRTKIIPERQIFYKNRNEASLDYKAICVFAAIGFFLEKDTYYTDSEALQPATDYTSDENHRINSSEVYWKWHYTPRQINLKQATEEFAELFESLNFENLKGKKVILPLSGGLDSRTQAVAVDKRMDVKGYSYKFENSFDETKYGREICKILDLPYSEFIIPKGYLWKVIDELAEINQCCADFTHPRQMAVIKEISGLGNVFFLGHWGDVLFDSMGIKDDLTFDEQINTLTGKLIKNGGTELAEKLWKHWEIPGNFREYFDERISGLLSDIKIDNANSRIRAFKSTYWAPRWTSANMNVFSNYQQIYLPYYSDEMCKFICTIPEEILSGRKIQIEYIKMKNPELAKISWQSYDPLNLYNYKTFSDLSNLPNRILRKANRFIKKEILKKKEVKSNWEIQFLGRENEKELKNHLFMNSSFKKFIPEEIVFDIYGKFINGDSKKYSHPVSMLLTLSQFSKTIKT
ncbi:MAG: asparagine synthetase B family protein [Ignavibacteria bacterium]|nr:asparagine synthetase B family protein [Ignavibacteria bacterium]